MIFKKTKDLIDKFKVREEYLKGQNEEILTRIENLKKQNDFIIAQNAELEWGTIYHDTINDKEWLKSLALSPGRWAANYSLLYILVRILCDYQPKKILELGLGESSKIISCCLDNQLKDSKHFIIEQDESWINNFTRRFELSLKSHIINLPIQTKIVNEFSVNSYSEIEKRFNEPFDFYIVDGPSGSSNFSRYDICLLSKNLNQKDEFIIVVDDYHRTGEKQTVEHLRNSLTDNGIVTYTGIYQGKKDQIVIATEKYKSATSL
jgi:hypothetical protein